MGTGIMGAIPISFRFDRGSWDLDLDENRNKEMFMAYAPTDFFDFYNQDVREVEKNGKVKTLTYYVIKPEILLPNFKEFFIEFHKLIGNYPMHEDIDGCKKFNKEYNAIIASNDIDKFVKYFDDSSGYAPTIFPYFEPMYITMCKNLLVYQGSYKAILEEWSTLEHMERLLWAAMKHPLAKVMRFGVSL
jgi:hypothetical protein